MDSTVWLISDSLRHARRLERRRQDHGTRGNAELNSGIEDMRRWNYKSRLHREFLWKFELNHIKEQLRCLSDDNLIIHDWEKEKEQYQLVLAEIEFEEANRNPYGWNLMGIHYEEDLAWEEWEDRYWSGFDLTPEELEKQEQEEHDLEVMEDNEWAMTHDQDFWNALYEDALEEYLQQH